MKYCRLAVKVAMCGKEDCFKIWAEGKKANLTKFSKLVDAISVYEKQDYSLVAMVVDKLEIL